MNFFKQLNMKQRLGLLFSVSILFLDLLLYSVIIPLTPYYERTFETSPTMIGLLFSSYSITMLLFTPYFGNLTDRVGRKKPILFGLIGLIISTLLFAYPLNFEMLIFARALQGITAAATGTAVLALLADLFLDKERAVVMGFAITSMSAGMLMGAPIGGLLIEVGDYGAPFYTIIILLIMITVLAVIYLKEEAKSHSIKSKKITDLLKQRAVIWILSIMLISEGTLTMLEPILPIYLSEAFTGNSLFIGLMFGVLTLAYGLMAPISGILISKYTPSHVVLVGLLLLGLLLPSTVLVTSTWQLIIVLFFVGGCMGLAVSPTLTMLGNTQGGSEENSYGALYSLFNMFFAVSAIIGPFIGGLITDVFTSKTTIFMASGVILICTIGLSISRGKIMYQGE